MKIRRILGVTVAAVLAMSSIAYAATPVTKEYKVTSEKKDFASIQISDLEKGELAGIKSEIREGGKRYKAAKVSAEAVKKDKPVKRKKTYTGLTEKKVKKTLKLKSGETLTLSDVKWTEQTRTAVTGSLTVTGSDSRPDVPETKGITATLPDGSTITVTGKLQSVEKTGSSYSKPFSVKATFTGDEDVDTYMMGDTAIPNNPDSPAFSGYETAILTHLGLDPDQYKITDAKWTSGYVQRNGQTVRYAEYSGQRLTNDWTAYYAETITAGSPQLITYDAVATYTNGVDMAATDYLVTVTYEKAGLTLLQKILLVSAAVIVIAGLIAAILLIVRRKREKTEEAITIVKEQ